MKISELSTDRAADVLCEVSVYALPILSDEELMDALKKKIDSTGTMTRAEVLAEGAAKIGALVPIVLKKHKADVFGLLAVLNETTAEKIAEQNIIKTLQQAKNIAKDRDLLDFFKSCAQEETK